MPASGSAVARSLRECLAHDLRAEWMKFKRAQAKREAGLGLDLPDELRLGWNSGDAPILGAERG